MTAMTVEEAYDAYADTVYRFFYIKCLDTATAQDLTSQTFMVLVERLHDLQDGHTDGRTDEHNLSDAYGDSRIVHTVRDTKKFVYGVMRNIWLMYLRKKYQRNEQAVEDIEDFAAYVDDEIADYTEQSPRQRAEVFINQLPDRQRTVVAMRLLEEQSIKQIAVSLDKDINYVKTTYKRGLKRLRQLAQEAI